MPNASGGPSCTGASPTSSSRVSVSVLDTLAAVFLFCAFAKLTGMQFAHFEIDERTSDVGSVTLVWYFFGCYSSSGVRLSDREITR